MMYFEGAAKTSKGRYLSVGHFKASSGSEAYSICQRRAMAMVTDPETTVDRVTVWPSNFRESHSDERDT